MTKLDYRRMANAIRGLAIDAVENASPCGWERYTGSDGRLIGVDRFGASASAEELYDAFGLTAANVSKQAQAMLGRSSN